MRLVASLGQRLAIATLLGALLVLFGVGCRGDEQLLPPSVVPPPGETDEREEPRPAAVQLGWGVVLVGAGGLAWLDAEGSGEPRVLEARPDQTEWFRGQISPDGCKVAVVTDARAVEVLDLVTGGKRVVARSAEGYSNWKGSLPWAPDSKRLAYIDGGNVCVAGVEGSGTPITQTGDATSLSWSPDGKQIAFSRADDALVDLGLWRVEAAGGEPTQVAPSSPEFAPFGAFAPVWSPDAQTMAFLHAYEGGYLCLAAVDGSRQQLDIGVAWTPLVWLADGSGVVYEALEYPEPSEGVMKCAVGGEPEAVVEGPVIGFDALPSGEILVAQKQGPAGEPASPGQVRVWIERAGAEESESAAPGWEAVLAGSTAQCRWRPDGKAIAVLVREDESRETGTVYAGLVGDELQAIAEGVKWLVGWAKADGNG